MTTRVVLAYVQARDYQKGQGTKSDDPIPTPFATLTRLGTVIDVRKLETDGKDRYYIDIELNGYPYDTDGATGNRIIEQLKTSGQIPLKTFVAEYPDNAGKILFQTDADDQAYAQVIDRLSAEPSQFSKDTFWRLTHITAQTKSIKPLTSDREVLLKPTKGEDGERRYSFFDVKDQTTIKFHLQFYRGREEHGIGHRTRTIVVEAAPKATTDLVQSKFQARSFGQESVVVAVPATTSLSEQSARFRIATELHELDEQKVYPYGPQLEIHVRYSKDPLKISLAFAALAVASGLFAFAAFATSVLAVPPGSRAHCASLLESRRGGSRSDAEPLCLLPLER